MVLEQPGEIKERHDSFIQSMLDASMHGIMLLDPIKSKDGVIIDFIIKAANTAFEKQVGIKGESTIGKPLTEVFATSIDQGFFEVYATALQQKEVLRKELFYDDGTLTGWFDIGVAPHEDALVVTFVNITEKKQYQQNIERSMKQLNAIIDIAQSGMFLFSPVLNEAKEIIDFSFTYANRSLASYVGQEPETLINDLGSKWFPTYKTNGLFDLYKETYETGKTNRFDFHYNADGIDVWLDILSTKHANEVLVTFTDYTSIKQLQLKLEAANLDLKRSNANLEDFAYAASHDLQEPLRKITYYAERLKTRFHSALSDDGAVVIDRIEAASKRMSTLIEDLLAYSKVSSTREPFELVDTNSVVQQVLVDLETRIHETNANVSVDHLPTLEGDVVQLTQMFQNLISNSLKYNRTDIVPQITIRSKLLPGSEMTGKVKPEDDQKSFHCIEVEDNGIGFEQEHAERIFKIFQRLHGRSEYAGTGVGLAIVQKVIENHNGYIFASSQLAEGATFTVLLPA
ncbi:MAG: hypothetical protein JWQ96_829 [Segetibacter sp.]|jgi:signal transduction histidine kinase|nr:hypothetical protein [Segetibacter sp.]